MTSERVVRDAPDGVPEHGVGLPRTALRRLGIDADDIVTVAGDGRTAGLVIEIQNGERDAVYLPERIQQNASVDTGETAEIRKAERRAASTIHLKLADGADVSRVETVVRKQLDGVPVSEDDRVEVSLLGGGLTLDLSVTGVEPESPAVVGEHTSIHVSGTGEPDLVERPAATYDDLAGVDRTASELDRLVTARFEEPEAFVSLGRPPGLGVLLHGPAGTGRSTVAEAVATETGATFVAVPAGTLLGGDPEEQFESVREAAKGSGPALVLFKDLELLEEEGGVELVTDLGTLIEDLRDRSGVAVVGATTRAGSVPDALRRNGRLDRELAVDAPGREGREAVLSTLLSEADLADSVDIEAIAGRTHGFVTADIATLVDRALEYAVARDGTLRGEDFDRALEVVEPSGLRDLTVDFPEVSWDDVGGLTEAKREMVRAVHWPLAHPEYFDDAGVDPPRGVLLYGPPGTGKTLLARAVASISDANFISVKGPELLDRYVGASEQAVRDLFEAARRNAPTVIFFDEVDALSPERRDGDSGASERVVSQLLTELDGLQPLEEVFVIAATNRPDIIDPALLRPGRLEKAVETPLPDRQAREEILQIHTEGMPLGEGVNIASLAERTEGFSGGDLAALAREAAMLAIELTVTDEREIIIGPEQFEEALDHIEPSVGDSYEEYAVVEK